jgi:DNA primase
MSSIDEIKARIEIVDLVSETVQLRRSGKSYSGFCPFHPNTRTPAFVVFPESGTWRCFGQCNEGGDIFRFVMKKEGWDFSEALRFLAEKAGVQLKPPTPAEQALVEEHDALRALLEEAVTFYRHNLFNTPAGQQALNYLHKRGLSDATIEKFGLGYAPNSWEAALNHFKSKGHNDRNLLEAGLVSERQAEESGEQDARRTYDRFRHRIMFPIRDERGRMAGFGARILNPEDLPKFLNSPQTPVFDKSHLLYGLDRARRAIRTAEQAVIVEGYLDVIALHQAGFENAVSPMGTALTEHQLRLLKRLTRRIVLALDPDAAGDKATLRGLQVARQTLDHTSEAYFDARGLLAHETRLQADIRVTTLPPGNDPDEIVQRDPQEWQRIVAEAKPIVVHVMETLATGRNVEDAKVKSEIAAQVLPLIKEVPNAIEREAYRQRLARVLRVDERALLEGEGQARPVRPTRRREAEAAAPTTTTPHMTTMPARTRLEAHCLGVIMRRPELVFRIDRELQEDSLPRLSRTDFDRADYQTVFSLVQESLAQDVSEPASFVLNGLSLPLMEVADELLKHTETLDPVEDRVLEDVLRGLLDLRKREINQSIGHLRFMLEEAQEQGDMLTIQECGKNIASFSLVRSRLDKAMGRFTSRLAAATR